MTKKTNADRLKDAIEVMEQRNMHYEEGYETDAINFIIEQAERAQKLEGHCKSLTVEWRDGVLENKRLREALDFYADQDNWIPFEGIKEHNEGGTAREALEESKDG